MSQTSNQLSIPRKIAKRAQRDIESICRQLHRFAKMTLKERMAYLQKHPQEAFCRIPQPDGIGHYQCGSVAWEKLQALKNLVLELDPSLGGWVGDRRARDSVIDAFVDRILRERREVTEETATLILHDSLSKLKSALLTTEHFFPCVLFPYGGADQFNVGPVTFTRRARFFKDKKDAFRHSIETAATTHTSHVNAAIAQGLARDRAYDEAGSKKLVRGLYARAFKTYRSFPWIASVTVIDCDSETAEERGARAAEMAIYIIRVMLGAKATERLRLAWSRGDALRTAHFRTDVDGVIHVRVGSRALGPVGVRNWHEILMWNDQELTVLGSALTPIVSPIETYHLHQRLVDAIRWFGDAANDTVASSSIIKYVSSIERLFFGQQQRDRKRSFANRIKKILAAFDCEGHEKAYEQSMMVYDMRSALLHGDSSPGDGAAQPLIHCAEALSRMSILCSTQLYPMMLIAYKNPDARKLDEVLERVMDEGVDWLAAEAGLIKNKGSE